MMMKKIKRIITWMGYPDWINNNPQTVLGGGCRVIALPEKTRLYTVREVVFDDNGDARFSVYNSGEKTTMNLQELKSISGIDTPILDNDNRLNIYEDEIRD